MEFTTSIALVVYITFRISRQYLSQCFCAVHISESGEAAGAYRVICDRFGGDVDGGDRECDLSADEGGAGAERGANRYASGAAAEALGLRCV